ncbi:PREDICTED: RNA polymerase sigma factor sigC [Nicotiana attenuata]|uniref:Rna polymerase sigma factor sigc n=1 Tax=Nicotiana attenuata TaxID=49451 RepID=A0A314L5M8_NICAT|nr:PREDICTED: RNA polymerase sigma factor sigC [Nicotiana attenuata]OIT36910.1 rna polymerase sigma factor sigc [Nicotiana attenuata]
MGFRLHLKWGFSVQPPFSPNSASAWPSSHSFKGKEALYDPARSLKPFINGDCEPSHSDPFRVRTCLSDPQLWTSDISVTTEIKTRIGRGSPSNIYGDIGSDKIGISPDGEKPLYLNTTRAPHFSLLMKNIDLLENMFADSEMSRLENNILVQLEKLGALEFFHSRLSRTLHSTFPEVLDVPRDLIEEIEKDDLVGNGINKVVVRSRKKQERKSRRNRASGIANDIITVHPHTKNIQEDMQQPKFYSGKRTHASRNKRQKIAKNEAEMSRGVKLVAELERIRSILEEETGRVASFSSWAEAAGVEQKELQHHLHFGWYCRDELLKSTRSLVLYLARNYRGLGVAFEDLIQAGNMGVLQGAVRFDDTRGYKFSTYVQYWIRKSLSKLVAQHARGIRIPFTICKAINQIHKARKALSRSHGKFPGDNEIAKYTGLSTARIAMASKCLRVVGSIDQKVGDCISAKVLELTPDKSIVSPEESVMREDIIDNMYALLESLDPKEQQVIYFRFGLENHQRKSLEEIGRLYGVSKEWIRRIERRALTKLRSADCFQDLTHYSV